jgi:probable HAF family extracellular repeat protein
MPSFVRGVRVFVRLSVPAAAILAAACGLPSGKDDEPSEIPAYTIRELGLLPGGATSQAYAINEAGTAVGYATDAGGAQRAVYFQGGVAIQLAEPDGTTRSNAYDINDNGVIVGSVRIAGIEQPCKWDSPTSAPELLELLEGTDRGRARSINNDGTIAGFVSADEWVVIWLANGEIEDLNPSVRESYEPTQINDEGVFVGNAEEIEAAYRWDDEDGFVFLGSLEGGGDDDDDDEAAAGESEGNGLNASGVTVGASENEEGELRAFRYSSFRGMVALGEPVEGDNGVIGRAINDAGLVAASSQSADVEGTVLSSQPAVTYMLETDRQFTALPGLGGTRAEPTNAGINQCGVIVGWSFTSGSTDRRAVAWVAPGCQVQ